MLTETFEWHDGIIDDVSFSHDARVVLTCRLYPSSEASERHTYKFELADVHGVSINIDAVALQDNRGAGNISDGRYSNDEKGVHLKLFLVDGYVHVDALSIRTSRLPYSPRS
jgi:hypothetical protein